MPRGLFSFCFSAFMEDFHRAIAERLLRSFEIAAIARRSADLVVLV
jgi:hypothetical protein